MKRAWCDHCKKMRRYIRHHNLIVCRKCYFPIINHVDKDPV